MSPRDICWFTYIYAGIYTTYIHIKCLLPNVFLAYLWVSSYVAWARLVTEMEQQERHSSHIRITAEKVTHTPLVAAMWQHWWKDHNWTWERTETEANRKQEWQRRIELQIRETAKAKSKDYRGQWVSRYRLPPGTERVHNSCLAMKPKGLDAHGSEMITSAGRGCYPPP